MGPIHFLVHYFRPGPISNHQIKCIYKALRTSADISKCCTETRPKTPNSKQCRCRSSALPIGVVHYFRPGPIGVVHYFRPGPIGVVHYFRPGPIGVVHYFRQGPIGVVHYFRQGPIGVVHYFRPGPIGVVHFLGNRLPFRIHTPAWVVFIRAHKGKCFKTISQ
jgi:hypothetical protein